jgi:charged multivesicular body protein 1
MGNKISLEDELVNLKITSKQMQRAAKKCEKNEKDAVNKLKKVCTTIIIIIEHGCY